MVNDGERSLAEIGAEVAALRGTVERLLLRQDDVAVLANAAQLLRENVGGLDQHVADVRQAILTAEEAVSTANKIRRNDLPAARKSMLKIVIATAAIVAISAFLFGGILFLVGRSELHSASRDERRATDRLNRQVESQTRIRHQQCLARNYQVAVAQKQSRQGVRYEAKVFEALRQQDPALAAAIARIPAPKTLPVPSPIPCAPSGGASP